MRKAILANVGLCSVVVGWALCVLGFSRYGDPSPGESAEAITSKLILSLTISLIGLFLVLMALWMSGNAFSQAKVRSAIIAVLVALPYMLFAYEFVGISLALH